MIAITMPAAAVTLHAAASMAITLPAAAYDAIPAATAPDPAALAEERAKKKKALQQRASKTNAEALALANAVSATTTSAAFVNALDRLSVWVVGQGSPRTCIGACQWLTAEDSSPLPEGFRTRELVLAVKATKDALPRIAYECEMTRTNQGICYSAGSQAEAAYQAFLAELKKRAPLQYETPYGPVAF